MRISNLWMAGAVALAAGASMAADEPPRASGGQTAAAQGVEQGSGTNPEQGGGTVLGSDGGLAGGTTIGSGVDTTGGTAGMVVDEGTIMRPLAAQGMNAVPEKKKDTAPRRKQLYGINPRADDVKNPTR
jgi:hypothetical protein